MFPIQLDRPLIVFDIEATGISPRADRIIELAAIRIEPDGTQVNGYWLLNPGVPIPIETTAIHGITDEIVASSRPSKTRRWRFWPFGEADLAGFNAGRFDIPMLAEELRARASRSRPTVAGCLTHNASSTRGNRVIFRPR